MTDDAPRRLLSELIESDPALDYTAVSLRIGRNKTYIQQYLKYNRPRALPEDVRETLGQLFDRDPNDFKSSGRARAPSPLRQSNSHKIRDGIQTTSTVAPRNSVAHSDRSATTLPRDVPVFHTWAGVTEDAMHLDDSKVIDMVRRPPGLAWAPNVYGIYMVGDSMLDRFSHGELIYVHPDRPSRPGDYVIIQIAAANDDDPAPVYVRRLVAQDGNVVVVEQTNPRQRMEINVEDIVKLHRILTTNELFGV